MSGYRADLDAIQQGGEGFRRTSKEYKNALPSGGFSTPTTGGGDADAALRSLLDIVELVHNMTADAAYLHGTKLRMAADYYRGANDATIARVFQFARETVVGAADPGTVPEIKN